MPHFLLTFGDASRPPVGAVILEAPSVHQARMTAVVRRLAPGVPFGEGLQLSAPDVLAIAADDDLGGSSAQNPLARCSRRGGMRPGALEIGTEREQLLTLRLSKRRRTPARSSPRCRLRSWQPLAKSRSSALQFAGDEPIGWINSIVLPTGMGNLIAGLLQGEFKFRSAAVVSPDCASIALSRGFHTEWLQHAQHLPGDRCVDV